MEYFDFTIIEADGKKIPDPGSSNFMECKDDPKRYWCTHGNWYWKIVDPDEEKYDFVTFENNNRDVLIYGKFD